VKKEKKKQHKVEKLEAEKSQVEVVKEEGK
jgi:hypothetical protein